jgi:hypothetical protein
MQILPQQVTRAVRSWKGYEVPADLYKPSRRPYRGIGELSYIESFMGALVMEFMNEGIELSLLQSGVTVAFAAGDTTGAQTIVQVAAYKSQ